MPIIRFKNEKDRLNGLELLFTRSEVSPSPTGEKHEYRVMDEALRLLDEHKIPYVLPYGPHPDTEREVISLFE